MCFCEESFFSICFPVPLQAGKNSHFSKRLGYDETIHCREVYALSKLNDSTFGKYNIILLDFDAVYHKSTSIYQIIFFSAECVLHLTVWFLTRYKFIYLLRRLNLCQYITLQCPEYLRCVLCALTNHAVVISRPNAVLIL